MMLARVQADSKLKPKFIAMPGPNDFSQKQPNFRSLSTREKGDSRGGHNQIFQPRKTGDFRYEHELKSAVKTLNGVPIKPKPYEHPLFDKLREKRAKLKGLKSRVPKPERESAVYNTTLLGCIDHQKLFDHFQE